MAQADDPIIILNPKTMTTFIVIHGEKAYYALSLEDASSIAESLKAED